METKRPWKESSISWRVTKYSGTNNVKSLRDKDQEAIKKIVATLGQGEPLIDISRYPFFGREDCHPMTTNFSYFVPATFGKNLTQSSPLLAAAMNLLNDELNVDLVTPTERLFTKDNLAFITQDKKDEEFLEKIDQTF